MKKRNLEEKFNNFLFFAIIIIGSFSVGMVSMNVIQKKEKEKLAKEKQKIEQEAQKKAQEAMICF